MKEGRTELPLLWDELVVHAQYDSHYVPPSIPYYSSISTFSYLGLDRVGVRTLRTSSGISQPDGCQTVIGVHNVM